MALHKIVNGVRIDLTPEEERATLAEWEANRLRALEERRILAEKEAMKKAAQDKISSLAGLSEEEKKILFG